MRRMQKLQCDLMFLRAFVVVFGESGGEFTSVSLPAEQLGVRQHMLQSAVVGYTEG